MRPLHTYSRLLFICIVFFQTIVAQAQVPVIRTANENVPPFASKFGYGSNMRGQSNGWVDETVAGIINKAGGTTIRATLPEHFIETWGINVRLNAFNTYTNTLGMKDLVCFVEGPSAAHQDKTIYPGNNAPSKLFANLYAPIWNADGTVNSNNYYANYIYRLVQTYGPYIRFWEVVNEPDLTWNADVNQWFTRAPLPSESPNTLAPFYHYVRMLRITWEVVKRYDPNDFVTTGGIGYESYLDALMRYTDNPTDGSVTAQYPNKGGAYFDVISYHVYPSYFLRYWDNSIGNFRFTQNSDFAAAQVIKHKNGMEAVAQKYGYNGATFPKKHFIVTETNISRRTAEWRYSTDEMQRNFGIKTLVLAQKNDIKQIHWYGVSESINAPSTPTVSAGDEYQLMGLYENLERDAPGNEKLTQLGVGNRTTSRLLNNYTYDAGRTAALNLPATVEGGAFVLNGTYVYALWAKNPNDKTENFTATYSFPASLNIAGVERFEWDHSSTNASTKQSSQGITLNTAPSFFRVDGAATTPAPAPAPAPPANGCTATGTILREQWNNISGTSITAIPFNTAPSSSSQLTIFEGPSNIAENYGSRIRGYVCVPQSGNYTFFIAADDDAELWLSTDSTVGNRRRIAGFTGWTAPREWTKYPQQQSVLIYLEAGRRYYIEALHKEGDGGDNLAVAWRLPNGAMEAPIPGTRLSAFVPVAAPAPAPAPAPTPAPSTCTATGTILREQWNNISGTSITAIPFNTAPSSSSQLNIFEGPTNVAENYGSRIRGYVCVPQTGNYTFFIAADDDAELWLSTDDNPANRRRIAGFSGWTAPREWTRLPEQQSASIYLESGRRYYIEALHKEGDGGDNLAVAWRLPNGTMEAPIAGSRLSPFVPTTVTPAPAPAPAPAPSTCNATGTILREQWNNIGGNAVSSIPLTTAPSSSSQLTIFEGPTNAGDNYGARIRGYICVPQTGNYTFFIAADDDAELWLSTDDNPANRRRIAGFSGWTAPREWTRFPEQQSLAIHLEAGRRYYIEALHKEGSGGDNLAVGWRLPNGTMEAPIAGLRLSPFVPTAVTPAPTPAPAPAPSTCTASGTILREQWDNVQGSLVSTIPVNTVPTSTSQLTLFEAPSNIGEFYGARIRGYICPPQSGNYTFFIAGDDNAELWLSTDDNPATRRKIAEVTSWTAPREWTKSPSQQSVAIYLEAGRRYYIEALHKEGWGGDNLAVGWRLPNGTMEAPIAGSRLSPFVPGTVRLATRSAIEMVEVAGVTANTLVVTPNPFNSVASVQIKVAQQGMIKLEVYDLQGRLLKQLFSGFTSGNTTRQFTLNGYGLTPGTYFIRLVTANEVLTKQVVLIR